MNDVSVVSAAVKRAKTQFSFYYCSQACCGNRSCERLLFISLLALLTVGRIFLVSPVQNFTLFRTNGCLLLSLTNPSVPAQVLRRVFWNNSAFSVSPVDTLAFFDNLKTKMADATVMAPQVSLKSCERFDASEAPDDLEIAAFPEIHVVEPSSTSENETDDTELIDFLDVMRDDAPLPSSPRSFTDAELLIPKELHSSISPRTVELRHRKSDGLFDEASFSWPSSAAELDSTLESPKGSPRAKRLRVETSKQGDDWMESRAVSHLINSPFDTSFDLLNVLDK